MSSFSRSTPKRRRSFLIKDILSDEARDKDEHHSNFTATSRFNKPLRNADVHCHDRRLPFHRNDGALCSCQQPGAFLGCTAPLSVRIPSPKFPCGCQVSTSRGRWTQDILCCQPQRSSQSPHYVSPVPSHRFPSPHQIKQDEMAHVKMHAKRNLSDSSIPSRHTEQGMFNLLSNTS